MATTSPIFFASAKLAHALDNVKVPYAIMGGAACFILGSTRVTDDIDLCVDVSGTGMTVEQVNTHLKGLSGFTQVDVDNIGYFIPAVLIPNGPPVPLELFDPLAWPQRPQYAEVRANRVARRLPDGTNAYVFSPAWLLREKIETVQERPGKLEVDLQDIQFLCSIIPVSEYRKGLLDLRQQPRYANHLRAFLKRTDIPQQIRSNVELIFQI